MFRFLAATILIASLAGAAEAQDGMYLRYAYPEGKRLTYDVKASSSLQTLGASLRQEWKSKQGATLEGDGSQRVTVALEDMFESEPASGGIVEREILTQLVDSNIQFTLSGVGDISDFSVEGLDRVPFRDRQMKQVILVQLRQMYAAAVPKLPTGEIKVKESWDVVRELQVKEGVVDLDDTYTSTYTIKKLKKKDGYACVEVEEKTEIETRGYMMFGPDPYRTIGSGTRKGKFLFDTERGILLEYEGDAKLDLKYGSVGAPEESMQASSSRVKFSRKLKNIEN